MRDEYTVGVCAEGLPTPGDDACEDDPGHGAERRQMTVPAELHASRLDKVLVTLAAEFSRNHLQGLIAQGHVRVGDVVQSSASRKLLAGQVVAHSNLLTVLPQHFLSVTGVFDQLVIKPLPFQVPTVHVDMVWRKRLRQPHAHQWLRQAVARASLQTLAKIKA